MDDALSRRGFLRGAVAAGGVAAASGTAGAQASFDGWLSNTSNYDGVVDETGRSEVTVAVGAEGNGGAFAFAPAAVRVDPGATVVWEWTGEGGGHNVVGVEGASFDSGDPVAEAGTTFEHTFEESGIHKYQCAPHAALGMKGVVVAGDVDLAAGGSGGGPSGGADGSRPWRPPGGAFGGVFLGIVFGGAALASLAVLGGEAYPSLKRRFSTSGGREARLSDDQLAALGRGESVTVETGDGEVTVAPPGEP